jgi:hypothetical protein
MNIKLRTATSDDAQRCGTICYEAFTAIAKQHNFPPDSPSAEVTIGLLSKLIVEPRFYAIVAEIDHSSRYSVAASETHNHWGWTCNGVPGGRAVSDLIQLR